MPDQVEKILESVDSVKLVRVEENAFVFRVIDEYERILHKVDFSYIQVGHFIKTQYMSGDGWLPSLRELELLADYFMFLRSLCEVTCFLTEEVKKNVLNLAKSGETHVVELCKTLYGDQWKEVLATLKTLVTR